MLPSAQEKHVLFLKLAQIERQWTEALGHTKTDVVQLREPYFVELTGIQVDSRNTCSVKDLLSLITTKGIPNINNVQVNNLNQ